MKVIDVHPEELLDRELRSALTAEQRTLLDVHLAHCESCRMERLLRADFAAEAVHAGEADMQSFVLGALQRAASSDVSVAVSTGGSSEFGSRRRFAASLAVACVLLVAAGAAASRSAWVERMFHVTFGEASIESSGREPKAIRKSRQVEKPIANLGTADGSRGVAASAQAAAQPQGVTAQAEPERPPTIEPMAQLAPQEPSVKLDAPLKVARSAESSYRPRTMRINNVRSPRAISNKATASKPAVVSALAAPEPVAAPDPAQIAAQQAASSMFEQANRARRSGHLDQAATLYETLQREFAASPEAKLSFALSARMWLDAGNAFAAYGAFERYLATGDRALREEAMTGRALSLERLGRKSAADAAFAELLQAYPYSSYAPLAKKRLGQD